MQSGEASLALVRNLRLEELGVQPFCRQPGCKWTCYFICICVLNSMLGQNKWKTYLLVLEIEINPTNRDVCSYFIGLMCRHGLKWFSWYVKPKPISLLLFKWNPWMVYISHNNKILYISIPQIISQVLAFIRWWLSVTGSTASNIFSFSVALHIGIQV
jgi:hypothetical protein